jgi:hypothetical protein
MIGCRATFMVGLAVALFVSMLHREVLEAADPLLAGEGITYQGKPIRYWREKLREEEKDHSRIRDLLGAEDPASAVKR